MDDELSAIMARRKRASEAKMASEAGAAPASDETGAPENRVTPASQNGPDAAVRRKKKASDPPTAWTTPAFVPAGAPENRARPASQDDPGEEAGAQVHEVSGIGASTGFSTGAEVKVPNEIVPKRREGGIGTFAGAVRVSCPQPTHPRLSTNPGFRPGARPCPAQSTFV